MNPVQVGLWCTLVLLCAYAFYSDLFFRRIPNWLCALVAVIGMGGAMATGGLHPLGDHALHMVIALAVGMVLTALGMVGAGDAKFYAACAAWFGLGRALSLLFSVSIAGLLLFVCWFAWRRIKRLPIRNTTGGLFDSLPYGIAIALGAVAAGWMQISA